MVVHKNFEICGLSLSSRPTDDMFLLTRPLQWWDPVTVALLPPQCSFFCLFLKKLRERTYLFLLLHHGLSFSFQRGC
jgi:hypothetical protein